MSTHGIAVVVLADYTPVELLAHPKCEAGLFTPITADGAPVGPVEDLITAEAPMRLLHAIGGNHQHLALWDEPIQMHQQVQCVGFERFEIPDESSLVCRQFLTLHLTAESSKAMEGVLSNLAHVHTRPARALLEKLPFSAHPNALVRRAFAFLHTDEPTHDGGDNSLVHVVPTDANVTPGHWTHGRLAFAAQALAVQLANQVLLDMLSIPDGRTPSYVPGGADEYVAAVRNYLAYAWWPDFSLDPATIMVAEHFYASTRLRWRVAEERETMRDIWAASEATNSRLLNRVGLVLGTSAVVAAWFALAAESLGSLARVVTAISAGALTLGLAAHAPRRGRLR